MAVKQTIVTVYLFFGFICIWLFFVVILSRPFYCHSEPEAKNLTSLSKKKGEETLERGAAPLFTNLPLSLIGEGVHRRI